MKQIFTSFIIFIIGSSTVYSQCSDLFFSEYSEGSSNNKALEIYNASDSVIDLNDYQVLLFSNGNSTANSTLSLRGNLAPYDVYVISNGSAALTGITNNSDTTSAVANFNGDDAVALINTTLSDTIDIIGEIGVRLNWAITGTNNVNGSTINRTLVRDPSIQAGQLIWSVGATEWIVLPQDEDDSLGFHNSICDTTFVLSTLVGVISVDSQITCAGFSNGSLSVSVSGGFAPYQYLWSTTDTTAQINGLSAGIYTVTITDSSNATIVVIDSISEPSALIINTSVTNTSSIAGADGAISLVVSGGTAPYSYSWSNNDTTNSLSNLSAGTYTVTVTDSNNCFVIASDSVQDPSLISLNFSIGSISCNGVNDGSIAVTASGGTAPYSYLWSNNDTTNSLSSLSAGTYTVTVTDSLSISTIDSIVLSEPLPLSITAIVNNVTTTGGSDGSIFITTSGGTPPYSFNWSSVSATDSLFGLAAGTYTVTVSDANSCTLTSSFFVIEPGPLANIVVTEIMYNPPEAGSDSLEFIEMVNTGMDTINLNDYQFGDGVVHVFENSMILPGQYFVIAIDSSAFRNVFGFDADFIWTSGALSNSGELITLIDNFGRMVDSVFYRTSAPWPSGTGAGGPNGGGASIELIDTLTNNSLGANWMTSATAVTGQIINNRQVFASPGVGPMLVSLNETKQKEALIRFYPNPTSGQLTIELADYQNPKVFQLLTLDGKVIVNQLIQSPKQTIDLEYLSKGIYFIKIDDTITKLILTK